MVDDKRLTTGSIRYLYHSFKHMSQGQEGNMDITGTHGTASLTQTVMDATSTDTQEGKKNKKTVSVDICTSTTLSNMWARGRKDSMTSSAVVRARD